MRSLRLGRVQSALHREHAALEIRERREAGPARGVVGEWRRAAATEERDQVARTLPHARRDAKVPVGVERRNVRAEPLAARLDGDLVDRNGLAAVVLRRTTREDDLDRLQDLAAAERGPRGAAAEQHLVDVVVEDRAEAPQVFAAQPHAEVLGDRVADRVGMAETLALDDLDLVRRGRERFLRADDELHRYVAGAESRMPRHSCQSASSTTVAPKIEIRIVPVLG